ncbi:MAG: 16S rRNA (cytosine(967)-C(5))-methyltransferase RsmB [Oscillospiraceae bacterium]|nr:16S rRNA (cytosine(967)-C(5))-methyltransferase RsmB [Oscillospiraceae bacterium]
MEHDVARKAALAALAENRKSGTYIERAVNDVTEGLSARDAAFCTWLCHGVVQNLTLLDFFIAQKADLAKIEPRVLNCLRLGVYQLFASETIPPSAAVNETVNLVRGCGASQRAVNFANAVMRNFTRDENPWALPPREPFDEYCAVRYSLPKWMIQCFIARLGEAAAEALCQAFHSQPPTTLQFMDVNKEELRAQLMEAGLVVSDSQLWYECLQVNSAARLTSLSAWRDGHIWVADVGAMLAIEAGGVQPGMKILDACAAPGGKTFALARALNGTGHITACDVQANKVKALQAAVKHMKLDNVDVCRQNAKVFVPQWENAFDLVVCDLPCSGLGVIAKKPDIRWKEEHDIAHLPAMQADMLSNLSRYVKPGGKLLYVTCTLLEEENEKVAENFTRKHLEFVPKNFECLGQTASSVTLWPHIHGIDGFFFASWEKIQ